MSKHAFFSILLSLACFGVLLTGLISCESVKKPETGAAQRTQEPRSGQSAQSSPQAQNPQAHKPQDLETALKILTSQITEEGVDESVVGEAAETEGWSISSFIFPPLNSQKGLQKALSNKSVQIFDTWTAIKTKDDVKMEKVSEMLLWSYSAVVFEKFLLFFSRYIIVLIVLPLFLIISILAILRNKEKGKTLGLIIMTLLTGAVIFFAIPLSLQASIFMEKTILPDFGSGLDITVENTMSYFTVFLFTYIIMPLLVIAGLIFLTVYISRLILGKKA